MAYLIISFIISFPLWAKDKYQSFEELSRHERKNQDYIIELKKTSSPISVFAIHGGAIEEASSELTQAIALDQFSQYHFKGIKEKNNFSLHITSHLFDEPSALGLAQNSKDCLSLHGYVQDEKEEICIGGGNEVMAQNLGHYLKEKTTYDILYPCKRFPGKNPKNVINRCLNKGVQLELSGKLRRALLKHPEKMNKLAQTIREFYLLK